MDTPAVVGLIRLDGADTLVVHRLDPGSRAALEIGMRVAAVFEEAGERRGHLDDVRWFTPA
jgi:hypothetical protein